jgi:hypothetical protein
VPKKKIAKRSKRSAKDNLQTIIVSKALAKGSYDKARKIAAPHAGPRGLYTCRETEQSFRFRQRPPSDFVRKSFRSFTIKDGLVLVYGRPKQNRNPSQRQLQWEGSEGHPEALREWDFWMEFYPKVNKVRSASGLKRAAETLIERNIQSPTIQGVAIGSIADRARAIGATGIGKSVANDGRIFSMLIDGRISNPKKMAKRKAKKKVKAPKYIKLKSPKEMPDPGPCSWLGHTIEWAWELKKGQSWKRFDENGNAIWTPRSEWMFMWSPKYKAVVAMRRPRNMYRLAQVDRFGGAAKMFEAFAARPAENTFEIGVPVVPLHELGRRAVHIVYRSDKWSAQRKKSDYIHDFGKGVKLYCGPSIQKPEVFLCFGGKLTLTERGLVW